MESDDTETVAALMRGPLTGFAAARSETVRALRKQGKPDLAKRIAALRKPSAALWILNQVGAVPGDDLAELRSAGNRLRQAQERLLQGDRSAVDEMSAATQRQRRAIDSLSRRLGMVLTASGHAASEETMRRVREDLRSASIGDSETWSALWEGRLLSEPESVSFPTLDITDMKRVAEEAADHAVAAQRKRLAAAAENVECADEIERTAREQEETARQRREQATEALKVARDALSRLHEER